jgi:C1A family cysteine protease
MKRLRRDLRHLKRLEDELIDELEEVKTLEAEIEQKIEDATENTIIDENKEDENDNDENKSDEDTDEEITLQRKIERKYGHTGNVHPRNKNRPFSLIAGGDIGNLDELSLMTLKTKSANLVQDKPFFKIGGPQQPYDQGNLGSCTANALAFCFAYSAYKQNPTNFANTFMPSRLDIYYQERLYMGKNYVKIDSGANISDCEYVLENIGVIPESEWVYYDDSRDKGFYTLPTAARSTQRIKMNSAQMYSVRQSEAEIKRALDLDFPVIFGMAVFTSFESATVFNTGIVPMPNTRREQLLGGHAIVIVGYTSDGYFIVRNSWGVNWGMGYRKGSKYNFDEYGGQMRGYFKIPVAYVVDPRLAMSKSFYVVQNLDDTSVTKKTYKNVTLNPVHDPRCARRIPKLPTNTVNPPTNMFNKK